MPVGDTFANSSYGYSIGASDALCFSSGFGERPITRLSGVFAFHSKTEFRDLTDGTSNTFAVGEAASGLDMCSGVGCTDPLPDATSAHGWLVGGAGLEPFYAAGFRYSGAWGSTVEPLNKTPVTDSFYKISGNDFFNCTPSINGGPHWVSNFRSFHEGTGGFLFCDGAVSFLSENIDMSVYRALSTNRGNEVVQRP